MIRQWLHAASPTLAARLVQWSLRAACLPYWMATRLRNLLYEVRVLKAERVELPIICVGNLSVGGTGKTPMVAWLCKWLRQRDLRVGIVSRGYGQLDNGRNDEALELELSLPDVPHLQNPDRVAAARLAHEELEMQVLVLDDGFQHRRLQRDCDIVLLDASQPPSTDWPLPAGLMREPWSGLKRARLAIITRARLASPARLNSLRTRIGRIAPGVVCVTADHEATGLHSLAGSWTQLSDLDGQSVLAFCGIGNPDGFLASLEKQNVVDHRLFPDHHAYSSEDVAALQAWAAGHPECVAVVCTMKDWVKLQIPQLGGIPLVAVQISVVFSKADRLAIETVLEPILAKNL